MSGSCLFMLTQWLDLAFARIGLPERFSWQYRANKSRAEDHSLGRQGTLQIQTSSWSEQNKPNLSHFLATVNLVFPVIDPTDPIYTSPEPSDSDSDSTLLNGSRVLVVVRQLVIVAGAPVINDGQSDTSSHILNFAFSNLTVLIQDESIHSVIALILMALVFRGRDDTEMAWRMLANAVPKAQALGLDRRFPIHTRSTLSRTLHRQQVSTWWSLFILDKVLSIELQRPPMVRDCFCDQEMLTAANDTREARLRQKCFEAIVELAKIQGQVLERLLVGTQEEESGKLTMEQAIRDKLQAGGELDQLLVAWAERLPSDLR